MVEAHPASVLDVAGHVHAEEQRGRVGHGGDSVGAEEEALRLGEDERLLPDGASPGMGGVGDVPVIPGLDCCEAIAAIDARGKPPCLRTDLGAFDVAFGDVAVDLVPGAEGVLAGGDRSLRVGRFEQEVDDAQAESEVVGAGLRVDKRASDDARDVPRSGDGGAVAARFDFDPATGRVGAAGGERPAT